MNPPHQRAIVRVTALCPTRVVRRNRPEPRRGARWQDRGARSLRPSARSTQLAARLPAGATSVRYEAGGRDKKTGEH